VARCWLRLGTLWEWDGVRAFGFAQAMARTAHESGFDGIFAAHHYVLGPSHMGFHPFLMLARMAAECPGGYLGTAAFVLPLTHPVEVAEAMSLLDVMCGGKFLFGRLLSGTPGRRVVGRRQTCEASPCRPIEVECVQKPPALRVWQNGCVLPVEFEHVDDDERHRDRAVASQHTLARKGPARVTTPSERHQLPVKDSLRRNRGKLWDKRSHVPATPTADAQLAVQAARREPNLSTAKKPSLRTSLILVIACVLADPRSVSKTFNRG
jgi:hypothetical protein